MVLEAFAVVCGIFLLRVGISVAVTHYLCRLRIDLDETLVLGTFADLAFLQLLKLLVLKVLPTDDVGKVVGDKIGSIGCIVLEGH